MNITNGSASEVSWFCFNALDGLKWIALASGNLKAAETKAYTPPDNIDGFYGVRFTKKGGGTELAHGTIAKNGTITFIEKADGTSMVTTSN